MCTSRPQRPVSTNQTPDGWVLQITELPTKTLNLLQHVDQTPRGFLDQVGSTTMMNGMENGLFLNSLYICTHIRYIVTV